MVTLLLLAPGSPLSKQADLRAAVFNVDGQVPLIFAPFVSSGVNPRSVWYQRLVSAEKGHRHIERD